MAKIPFNIKYRPQIESGEYKVETRDGRTVRVLYWDRAAKEDQPKDLKLCVLVPEDGGEAVYYYYSDGTKWVKDLRFDLFIVTPEKELTEFEKAIKEMMRSYVKMPDEVIKEISARLLELARKEIELEIKEQVVHDYWLHTADLQIQAKEEGFNEALKVLPRWRRWGNGACGNGRGIPLAIVKRGLNGYELVDALGIPGEQYIMLSDLEKLPGFKEN